MNFSYFPMFPNWRTKFPLAASVGSGVLIVAVIVGGASGLRQWRAHNESAPPTVDEYQAAPALDAVLPGAGSIEVMALGGRTNGPDVEVVVVPPDGATQMQLGFDPTFASIKWQPVQSPVTVQAENTGYQMLFVRFRSSPGTAPSPPNVAGVDIDSTFEAAVQSGTSLHAPSWVRPLSPTSLVVRIEAGRLSRSRDGSGDTLLGRPLDVEKATSGTWSVVPTNGGEPLTVTKVSRISRPAGNGTGADDSPVVAMVHDLILTLRSPWQPGAEYRLHPPEGLASTTTLVVDPATTVGQAIRVNQAGYNTGDSLKVAYLAGLLSDSVAGDAGAINIDEVKSFRVVAVGSGEEVFSGWVTERPGGNELGQGDLTGTEVYELDFSPLAQPGRYQVCVDGFGCSHLFAITDSVWQDLTTKVARAMFHQRSGIALGPPYTSVSRPRPYHPDDGAVVTESSYQLINTIPDPGLPVFEPLVAGDTGEIVPQAWGGHFDAGDWDRRIQHLWYTRAVVELVAFDPERWAALDVQIPESGNGIPDLLDEGLWTLDLFRRLQLPNGAIPGGIEAAEHPQPGTTSWSEKLAVYRFEPDPWSSYIYAGVAAETSQVLASYDPDRAADYLSSAGAAMEWALAQPVPERHRDLIIDQQAVAAAALLKVTGEARWHDLFVASTHLDTEIEPNLSCGSGTLCDAAWLYVTASPDVTDPAVVDLITRSLVSNADQIVEAAETTSYGWAVENKFAPLIWGLGTGGSPSATGLMRAWALTGNDRYRQAALRSAAVTLGANPTATVFLTGIGASPVRHPLIVDTIQGSLPVWAGTPVYGPHQVDAATEGWIDQFLLEPAQVSPLAADAPYLWQWFDVSNVAQFNEFTVFQSHAQAITAFGMLASAN